MNLNLMNSIYMFQLRPSDSGVYSFTEQMKYISIVLIQCFYLQGKKHRHDFLKSQPGTNLSSVKRDRKKNGKLGFLLFFLLSDIYNLF